MGTTRGFDRLVFFTDAVTAIALTVLILPLVDLVVSAADSRVSATQFLGQHFEELIAFLISFAVIARLWLAHHAVFEHIRSYSGRLVFLNMLWLLTIVVLPLPTAMTAEFPTTRFTIAFYIGTMTLSSLCPGSCRGASRSRQAFSSLCWLGSYFHRSAIGRCWFCSFQFRLTRLSNTGRRCGQSAATTSRDVAVGQIECADQPPSCVHGRGS